MKEASLIMYFGPMSIFLLTVFAGLFNTGLYFVLYRHGVIDRYEATRLRWMPKKCEFCLFFWLASVELCTWYTFFHAGPFQVSAFLMMLAFAVCAAVISLFFANYRNHAL